MMRLKQAARLLNRLLVEVIALILCIGLIVPTAAADPVAVDQIVLNISPQQVVGHPLRAPARALLLDDAGGLATDYDLAADPLNLSASSGSLSPNVANDPALFSSGTVNLQPLAITYAGLSGSVLVTASNSTVTSSGLRVSFSGYDIIESRDLLGQALVRVYGDLPTSVQVTCSNGGDLLAYTRPSLKCFFRSGGGSVKVFFDPSSGGAVNTITISLPTSGIDPGLDTLVFVLDATYRISEADFPVSDTMRVPVEVLTPATLELVAGSVKPDSIYAGVNFGLGFDVATSNFFGPLSTTQLNAYLVSDEDEIISTVYFGASETLELDADTIHYENLISLVPTAAGLEPGWYRLLFNYRLYSNGSVFTLDESGFDSLYIIPHAEISFDDASLMPEAVAAGQEARFQFDLTLDAELSVEIDDSLSLFRVVGDNFSSAANLVLSTSRLEPGVNQVTSGPIFVPLDQLGGDLTASATIVYRRPGAGNSLTVGSGFGGRTIHVKELPLVQIVSVVIVSPNAPNVNTNQSFQVCCKMANLSGSPMESPFNLQMVSDGESVFEPILEVDYIPPDDTLEFFYDVTAAPSETATEIFRIDIATVGVNELAPVDNIAIATVQTPADLTLGLVLRGAEGGYINVGDDFDLIVVLLNSGQGQVTSGQYTVNTNGVDLGLPGGVFEVGGTMTVGTVQGVSFEAPDFDTTAMISFRVTARPIDINTGLSAPISDTAVDLPLAVTTLDVALAVTLDPNVSNVVYPGADKTLLTLRVTNPGSSSITDIQLEKMVFNFEDGRGNPMDVRSLLEIGNTFFYDGSQRVATATAGGGELVLNFIDLLIAAGESHDLRLVTRIKAESGAEFRVRAEAADLTASFASGPLSGLPVEVGTGSGEQLVDEVFSSFAADLEASLAIRNNPFNPVDAPAEFRYYLDRNQQVRLRILTLTGQVVYERDFAAGSEGATEGENRVFWDGHNGQGVMVLNGVYVVHFEAVDSGTEATIKIAVLK